jgi:hypothetical protein
VHRRSHHPAAVVVVVHEVSQQRPHRRPHRVIRFRDINGLRAATTGRCRRNAISGTSGRQEAGQSPGGRIREALRLCRTAAC